MRHVQDLVLALAFTAPAAPAFAQNLPPGWRVRADQAGADLGALEFNTMPPGWHVTTGPAVILYHPDTVATGSYRVEAEVFLFDPGERREAFGVFFGGRDLESSAQRYSYFLIRQDGRYIIKRRQGADTPTLQPWTEHAAVKKWADRGDSQTVGNVLAVDVGPETVVFSINGTEVHRVPRSQLDTDGVIGLRVNHALNLHFSKIAITRK